MNYTEYFDFQIKTFEPFSHEECNKNIQRRIDKGIDVDLRKIKGMSVREYFTSKVGKIKLVFAKTNKHGTPVQFMHIFSDELDEFSTKWKINNIKRSSESNIPYFIQNN